MKTLLCPKPFVFHCSLTEIFPGEVGTFVVIHSQSVVRPETPDDDFLFTRGFKDLLICLSCGQQCYDNLIFFQCSHLICRPCYDLNGGRCQNQVCLLWHGMEAYEIVFEQDSFIDTNFDVKMTGLRTICKLESYGSCDWSDCMAIPNDEYLFVSCIMLFFFRGKFVPYKIIKHKII